MAVGSLAHGGKEKVAPIEKVSNILSYHCHRGRRIVSSSANIANYRVPPTNELAQVPSYHAHTSSLKSQSVVALGNGNMPPRRQTSMSSRHYNIFVRFVEPRMSWLAPEPAEEPNN